MDIDEHTLFTVTQLNRATSQLLAEYFMTVRVQGELSNLSTPSSGHSYFTLKDANAQIRCALFRTQQRRLNFKLENGKQVIVKAQVSLYEPRGDYQLIVDSMESAGEGDLRRAFDDLKHKLAAEGLFDSAYKQRLPVLPKAIGVITSATGAALHDILTVLKRRFAAIPVIIYPVAVQGEQAKYDISKAIAIANQRAECEVLIVGRGGGSLEDLWAFNEEIVARAIFASNIPIISAVGHETDITIADFVADFRAATPSAAAEFASPDSEQWLARFIQLDSRLQQQIQRVLSQHQQSVDWLSKRLAQQSIEQKLAGNNQQVNALKLRLTQAMHHKLHHQQNLLAIKTAELWQHNPAVTIRNYQQRQRYLSHRLLSATEQQLKQHQQRLATASQTLHAVSPLATLNRGYALTINPTSGQIIRSSSQLKLGDIVETRLAQGSFSSEIKTITLKKLS
ncbi:MAG: exodeoxyribonuclease VII large subunit [Methylococcales bacterium]|nr:exodeoxyribonuclease VII large subunit [Methylococcales bacterium]